MINKPIFNEEWALVERLGEGHTSKVYKVMNCYSGEYAALKIIKQEYLQRNDAFYWLQ